MGEEQWMQPCPNCGNPKPADWECSCQHPKKAAISHTKENCVVYQEGGLPCPDCVVCRTSSAANQFIDDHESTLQKLADSDDGESRG